MEVTKKLRRWFNPIEISNHVEIERDGKTYIACGVPDDEKLKQADRMIASLLSKIESRDERIKELTNTSQVAKLERDIKSLEGQLRKRYEKIGQLRDRIVDLERMTNMLKLEERRKLKESEELKDYEHIKRENNNLRAKNEHLHNIIRENTYLRKYVSLIWAMAKRGYALPIEEQRLVDLSKNN